MIDLQVPFVLPADLLIVPAEELSERDRVRAGCKAGEFVLSRRFARARSKVLGADALRFARQFANAKTLISAVSEFAQSLKIAPQSALEMVFPILMELINDGFLVANGSADAKLLVPTFLPGQSVASFKILKCMQLFDDTELYQVQDGAGVLCAMKIARGTNLIDKSHQLEREATILGRLDGNVNPYLMEHGSFAGCAFLVMNWCEGRHVSTVADSLRRSEVHDRSALLVLGISVVDAYQHLHRLGVVHGDIHPHNLLVDDNGHVTILDYGLARFTSGPRYLTHAARGGVDFFFEPEYASSYLKGQKLPLASLRGEQYSLACLIFFLLTGGYYLDFSFEKRRMYRQICDEQPRAFTQRGSAAWPEVETILAIALRKKPQHRFESVAAMAQRFRNVLAAEGAGNSGSARTTNRVTSSAIGRSSSLDLLLGEVVAHLSSDSFVSKGIITTPKCSVHSGASGIAYGLYRIACARSDPTLLAAADLWSCRAVRDRNDPNAYFDPREGVTEESVGTVSLFHSATGTACVQGLVSQAMGDFISANKAVELFVSLADTGCKKTDLFLGRSGLLLGCALLIDALADTSPYFDSAPLVRLGDDLYEGLWSELSILPSIIRCRAFDNIGVAHGWSGILYALMRWAKTRQRSPPEGLDDRLRQLADCAMRTGTGVRWPIRLNSDAVKNAPNYMTGWCNGGAGHVHTWVLAHDLFDDSLFLDLATRSAAQEVAETTPHSASFLCCGMTGSAYAMLTLYNHTGETRWLNHAYWFAEAATTTIRSSMLPRTSLFRGQVGLAVLAAELSRPERAAMPLFGDEGWPNSSSSSPRTQGHGQGLRAARWRRTL